jgi:hypothetical protein
MPKLKPRQQDLLAEIVRQGGLPVEEVDGRLLRPLRRVGLAEIAGPLVVATRAGTRHILPKSGRQPVKPGLNAGQEDLLRMILRLRHVPAEELDGRVARSLIARGLITVSDDDVVTATSAGRVYFEESRPQSRRGRKRRPENARAATVRRALRQLEAALPQGAEVLVGNIMASADDVVDGFRRHARMLDQGV